MKQRNVAKQLLNETNLELSDLARLTLEAIETLGEPARGLERFELVALLRKVIQEGAECVKKSLQTVTFEKAVWASVEARTGLRPASMRDLRHYARRILRVEGVAELPLRSITAAQCKEILDEAFGTCKSSYVKGRAILHSVFSYGVRCEWCDSNPVDRIKVPRIQEKTINPLTPEEVNKLKVTANKPEFRDMKFSLYLMLYGGIRPTEVSRLRDEDFCWEEEVVIIRPEVSKTGGGRAVPLRGLKKIRPKDRIIPQDWQRRWQALRKAAGFENWVPDVCRHTFASYHAAYFRNLSELQLEMGHRDVSLLRSRYMMPSLRKDAVRFWRGTEG